MKIHKTIKQTMVCSSLFSKKRTKLYTNFIHIRCAKVLRENITLVQIHVVKKILIKGQLTGDTWMKYKKKGLMKIESN